MIYDYLFDWQKDILNKYKNRPSFGLFLDCGLGKTVLSLAFAEANNCSKVMVITVNSKAIEDNNISGSWWDWATKSKLAYNINNKNTIKSIETNPTTDLLILNYESLFQRGSDLKRRVVLKPYIEEFLKNCRGHNFALIVDESHKMKNLQSLQTCAILEIQKLAKMYSRSCYTYLLTGTPFTTGFIDLYTQLKALGCMLTKGDFIDEFCIRDHRPGLLGWQQPIIGYKNIDTLYSLIHRYAITIKSKDVINLPEQLFVYHANKESDMFKLLTKDKLPGDILKKELSKRKLDKTEFAGTSKYPNPFYRNLDYPSTDYFAGTPGALWLRARQISIGFQGNAEKSTWYDKSRLKELERFLEQNEDNYLLFYNYTPELVELYDICERLGYNIDVYCGEMKSLVHYENYCHLDESEKLISKKNIILANFASGSTAVNWQAYNKCIIFSMPLYKDWEQGLKRIHRIGQNDTVVYHIFYQYNWLDMGMKKALEENVQYTEEMFKDGLKKEEKND